MSGSASITFPRSPAEPSAVMIAIVCDRRLASIGLNTRSRSSAPTTMSTRLCRARSSCARKYSDAAPCPSATSRQFVSFFGYANALPSGPITSRNSCARAAVSHSVPGTAGLDRRTRACRPSRRAARPGGSRSGAAGRTRGPRASPMATNCPGRARSAISGATSVREWYAPRRRVDRISARTRLIYPTAPAPPAAHGDASSKREPDLDGRGGGVGVVLLDRARLGGTARARPRCRARRRTRPAGS